MKGVILHKDDKKSIVLFNNGTFGTIPASCNCEEGMVVTVSYNKKRIIIAVSLTSVFLALLFFLAHFLYFTPVGYLHISRGAELEIAYNRVTRILTLRPLNPEAVAIAAGLDIKYRSIPYAWEHIISALNKTDYLAGGSVETLIAQDNLNQAKDIQSTLLVLSEHMKHTAFPEFKTRFSLYTIELYQKAATGRFQMPPHFEEMRRGRMMMHGMMGNGH